MFLKGISLQRNIYGSWKLLTLVNVLLSFTDCVLITNIITFDINLVNDFGLQENSTYIKIKT